MVLRILTDNDDESDKEDGASADDDEEEAIAQNRMHLRTCLLQLDALADSLKAKHSRERRPGGKGSRFDGALMMSCVRLMMHVRNRSTVPEVIDRALEIAIPTLAAECRASLTKHGQVPHGSTLSRVQPCFDAAIL